MLGLLKSWTSGLGLSWGGFFSQGASLPALGSNCWPTWEMLGAQLIARSTWAALIYWFS